MVSLSSVTPSRWSAYLTLLLPLHFATTSSEDVTCAPFASHRLLAPTAFCPSRAEYAPAFFLGLHSLSRIGPPIPPAACSGCALPARASTRAPANLDFVPFRYTAGAGSLPRFLPPCLSCALLPFSFLLLACFFPPQTFTFSACPPTFQAPVLGVVVVFSFLPVFPLSLPLLCLGYPPPKLPTPWNGGNGG